MVNALQMCTLISLKFFRYLLHHFLCRLQIIVIQMIFVVKPFFFCFEIKQTQNMRASFPCASFCTAPYSNQTAWYHLSVYQLCFATGCSKLQMKLSGRSETLLIIGVNMASSMCLLVNHSFSNNQKLSFFDSKFRIITNHVNTSLIT